MYDAACRACESHVHIKTTDELQEFLGRVHTSRRRERGGQITTTDIPALGIAKNLRVESSPTRWSFLKLEEFAASFPLAGVRMTLWNPSAETLARHRNHLFGIDLRPEYLLPDELHTALWDFIICDVWRASQGMGVQESSAFGGLRLEYELNHVVHEGEGRAHDAHLRDARLLHQDLGFQRQSRAQSEGCGVRHVAVLCDRHDREAQKRVCQILHRCLKLVKLSGSTWTSLDPMDCVFRLQPTTA